MINESVKPQPKSAVPDMEKLGMSPSPKKVNFDEKSEPKRESLNITI